MTRLFLSAAFAAAALTTSAGAQSRGWMQGELTRQQATQMADMMFQRFDLNHDGVVTRQEIEQTRAQRAGKHEGRMDRKVDRLFGNADSITLAQAQAAALARFDAQDLNHDGVVTAAEREQARASRAR
jgi:Ca2+-binding EF-hand superfamily protein